MIKVVARGSRIEVSTECLNIETTKKAKFSIGGFEVFLSAEGKGKEIEKLNDAIRETKALLKIAKNSSGINENYYSLSKQLKLLRERKRELEKIPEDELDEVVVEFIYEQNLKLVYKGKIIEINDIYQDLFLVSNTTSLFIVIVK
jgi:hypothetical protein